ncbi:hypothetical protein DFA_09305 [Cavenderia fasciculata]|uniref:Flavin-containing monooxygenase n=1 Tax=Cavenderia fasciculata TaxID=261658 RepID=F4Q793_CACFS|nr:uncharacterized protein DFA_09305 [Cavenderia fasciculata]EGG16275.1 hypothetical protein DFA_09305 [Cavenderia fasciculata]|eukprot:XP_004354659.1 hypothetical protein DFA_09305 [Cavenderia fasciculata]
MNSNCTTSDRSDERKKKKSVGIVGGGVSGLTTAKAAIECGLVPTVFERNDDIGGVWNEKDGYTWDSMKTNLSYYSCMYSDYPWKTKPAAEDLFPSGKEVQAYLKDYATHFEVYPQCIKFECTVTRVHQDNITEKWTIEWTNNNKNNINNSNNNIYNKEEYDYVIIASGYFSQCDQPSNIGQLESVFGKDGVSYVRHYKHPDEALRNKKIVMVGGSYSGCEIAVDLASTVGQIVMVTRHRPWYMKRSFSKDGIAPIRPLDINFFTRNGDHMLRSHYKTVQDQNKAKYTNFSKLFGHQQTIPSVRVDGEPTDHLYGAITDRFVELVEQGKIVMKYSDVDYAIVDKETGRRSIKFKDGSVEDQIDHLYISTGYKLTFPFFDQDMLDALQYDPNDGFQAVLLHKTVFCPGKRGIAFVGIFKGPFFGLSELQSRWATMVFTGKDGLDYPTKEEFDIGIAEEQRIRSDRPRKQWPHGNTVEFSEDLAKQIKCLPDFDKIQKEDPYLYKMLWYNFISPVSYRLQGFGSNPKLAIEHLKEIDSKFNNFPKS